MKALIIAMTGALLSQVILADTIVLKNGSTITGSIVKEDKQSCSVRIEKRPGFFVTEEFAYADIRSVKKTPADEKAYNHIKTLLPTRDRLPIKWYSNTITKKVLPFIHQHPESEYLNDVREILNVLNKEMQAVANGGVKFDGRLYTAQERQLNAYDIDSRIVLADFKRNAKFGYYRSALKKLEILERDFPHSKNYYEALDMTSPMLARYEKSLKKMEANHAGLIERTARSLRSLETKDRRYIEKAIAEEERRHKAALVKDEANGSKWTHVWERNKASIDNALAAVTKYQATVISLIAVPSAERPNGGTLFRKTTDLIASGQIHSAEQALQELIDLKFNKKYLDALETSIDLRRKEISELEAIRRRKRKWRDASDSDEDN